MVPRHKQPGRAEMMKGYRHKSKQKIQFLVQELKRKLEATGSVSTTSGMKSVLHSAISLCSSYAGENGAHKYTLNSEVTVESPLVMPPAAVATQTQAYLTAKTVVLPSILTASPSMIIAPTMTQPAPGSYEHPSLEILHDEAAEAMLEFSKGIAGFGQ